MRSKRTDKKKPRKRWLKILIIIILLFALGIGVYAFTVYNNAKKTVNDKIHDPVDSIDLTLTKKKIQAKKPLNILLMGIDTEENDQGRSDALMVLSLDPKEDAMQLISIPRDTRTIITGKGFEDKINHAYAYGGSDMTVATVQDFLDVELDYYVRMNMTGLHELIDELGGITVDNEIEWDDGKYHFTKGPESLDGDKAMHFVRMRKQDPEGDLGRTKRQRKVIEGIIDKGASVGSVTKIDSMIDILGNNMATNLDFEDMKKLLSGYRNTRSHFTSYQMEGSGTTIDGIYYLLVPDEEVQKVHNMIRK